MSKTTKNLLVIVVDITKLSSLQSKSQLFSRELMLGNVRTRVHENLAPSPLLS